MCHDTDSRPPAPPRSEEVIERGTLTLTAADGTEFAAAYAAPAGAARAGVVILPDIRGLHPYYVALAERFAEAGVAAVAIDWFGRTAGVPEDGTRGEDFDWQEHIPKTTAEGIDADVYSHPVGFHGHGAGPAIGLWDQQGGVTGAGDYRVHADTVYALELAVRRPAPEWDGQCVRMALEQGIALTGDGVEYLAGRQTELILIPGG